MNPALSVILFTTLSGAGYGLLFWIGALLASGFMPGNRLAGAVAFGLGVGLVTVGLLSSTLHLGHPERAWRALSQWRSSWLSREGVVALVSYLPMAALAWIWLVRDGDGAWAKALAVTVALISLVTVFCTAMIYATLKPIRQWHQAWVPWIYLLFALMSGAVVLLAVMAGFGVLPAEPAILGVLVLLIVAWLAKLRYWSQIDAQRGQGTVASATGQSGSVRFLDPPHSEENYLLKEMGYRLGRKHGRRLRRWALLAGWLVPSTCLGAGLFWTGLMPTLAVLAAIANLTGVLIERWLFFAQATHTVTLYYGAATA